MNLHTPPPTPYAADIRAALERVTGSAEFRSSPQLVAFLRVIVGMTLNGEADRIKAYTIGTDALGRDQSFDPQRDPIVRVEANRLRRTLAAHYAGTGANDPIIIEIPPGRYVPTFRLRFGDDVPADAPAEPVESSWGRRLFVAGAAVLAVALIAGLVAAEVFFTSSPNIPYEPPAGRTGALVGGPVVVIEPVRALPASASSIASDLNRELINAFVQVQAITVIAGPGPTDLAGILAAGMRPFRLTGIVESQPGGGANAALQLVTDGVVLWAREWRISADNGASVEKISRDAATEVGGWFGVVHSRLRAEASRLAPGLRCLLAAADYLQKFDLTKHERIRDCLENGVAEDSRSAITSAALAFVYMREYFHDLALRPGDPPPLERAHRAVQRALAIDPNSVIGHLASMEDLYVRGDLTAAFAAGETALSLNPNNPAVTGLVGLRLALGGQMKRGTALMEEAASHLGVNPSWLDFGLFCMAYLNGDMTAAAHHARFQDSDTYPYGMIARALVAAASGDRIRAQRTLIRLKSIYPGWSQPRMMLERFIRSPEIVDRLAHDIGAITIP